MSRSPPNPAASNSADRRRTRRRTAFDRARAAWVGQAALVGLGAGIAATAFRLALDGARRLLLAGVPALSAADAPWWPLVVVPALGGLAAGLLCHRVAPEAAGAGTDGAIRAFHRAEGRVAPRLPVVKFFATLLTLGSGGAGGAEGPVAQIGAGIGSLTGRACGLDPRRTRVLLVSGMAAGIAAFFEAPLAAMIFAGEILYRGADIDGEVLVPSAISSVVGYSVHVGVLSWWTGAATWTHLFRVPAWTFRDGSELLGYTALALACGGVARVWIAAYRGARDAFERSAIPPWGRPAVGGLITGGLAAAAFLAAGPAPARGVLGGGYGPLQAALDGAFPPGLAAATFLLCMAATASSIGSGGSGGAFGPSLVLGGLLGSLVAAGLRAVSPALVADPGAYALVGMAALFGAASHAPICSVIMISEITGSYGLLVPSIWVCTLAFLLVGDASLFAQQVQHIEDSPAHRRELRLDLLEDLRCGDWMTRDVVSVRETDTFDEILDRLIRHRSHHKFPVVDQADRLLGLLSLDQLREFFRDPDIREVAIAGDAMQAIEVVVTEDTSLQAALETLDRRGWSLLAVVDDPEARHIRGVLTRRDILLAYNHDLLRRRQAWEEI